MRAQVLVIEGATLACASIARAFSPTFHVEAASSWRAGRQLMTRPFVGLVVDLDMPPAGAALEFLRALISLCPALRALAIASDVDADIVNQLQRLGVELVCRDAGLAGSIRRFARRIAVFLHTHDDRHGRCVGALAEEHDLSLRQAEILTLAVERLRRDEMALRLGISVNTLKTETRGILRRTHRSSLGELAWMVQVAAREPGTARVAGQVIGPALP